MARLLIHFDPSFLGLSEVEICRIECNDLLEGLGILHERLNEVAMPRQYSSTVYGTSGLDARDDLPTTISC